MRIGISLALFLAFGCGRDNAGPLGGGGGDPHDLDDLNDNGGDNSDGGSDTGGPTGDPPMIIGVSGSWDGDSDPPRVLMTIDVTDPDNDLHNGKVGISVDGNAEDWFLIQDPDEDGSADSYEAVYIPGADGESGGQVEVNAEFDEGIPMDVTLLIRVKDAATNVSDPYEFTPQ
jgi:hypothetical protein